jgi:long-chain acyl-CoA synthetase
LAVAKQSEAISLVEIAAERFKCSGNIGYRAIEFEVCPRSPRLDQRNAVWRAGNIGLKDLTNAAGTLSVRAGDCMIISENCIALAALLLAASRIDGADCNVNRQSPQAQTRGVPAERVSRPASAGPMQ